MLTQLPARIPDCRIHISVQLRLAEPKLEIFGWVHKHDMSCIEALNGIVGCTLEIELRDDWLSTVMLPHDGVEKQFSDFATILILVSQVDCSSGSAQGTI